MARAQRNRARGQAGGRVRQARHFAGTRGVEQAEASANELGVHVQIGYEIVAQSVAYPFPAHYCRQIREEIDPSFVPLWINKLWRSPNGGEIWTGHHMLARHVAIPRESSPRIKNLTLPSGRTYGIRYENPILECDILDGLTDMERNRGALPRFEQFTGRHLEAMRCQMWMRNNLTPEERFAAMEELHRQSVLARQAATDEAAAYRRRNDAGWRAKAAGERVFVSDTLRTIREAAGMESNS